MKNAAKHLARDPRHQLPDPHLRSVWALFEPLTNQLDPRTLWEGILDIMIGNFYAMQDTNVPIGGETQTWRDYDRARHTLGTDEHIKEQTSKIVQEIFKVVGRHNSPDEKRTEATIANITYCYLDLFTEGGKRRWLDFFGDFNLWLGYRYDLSVLAPCCATVSMSNQWALAQVKGFPTHIDGEPVSMSNRVHMANPDAGSGRTSLAIHALRPGCFTFTMESDNLLHCKYAVLNALLHGMFAQVTYRDKGLGTGEHWRTWDVNRWLWGTRGPLAENPALMLAPHLLEVEKEQSYSWNQFRDRDGSLQTGAEEKMRDMHLDSLNRIGEGLGINLKAQMKGEVMFIGERHRQDIAQQSREQHRQLSGKAKSLTNRLFAQQRERQQRQPKQVDLPTPTTTPAPPTNPPKRTMGRRR